MTSRNRMTLIPATLLLTIMLPIGVLAQSNHMTLEQLFGMPPDEWREQQEAELKQIIEDVIQMNGEPHQSSAQQALQVYLSFTHPSSSVVNGRMDFIWYWLDPPRYASPWFRKASRCPHSARPGIVLGS